MNGKRKLSVLVVLSVFGLLLWGRLLIRGDVPRTAVADPKAEKSLQAQKSEPDPPDIQ